VWLMACATHPSVTPWIGVIANDLSSLSFTMKLHSNRVRVLSSPSRNSLTAPTHSIYLEEGTYHKRLFRGPNTIIR
jgi:hypothetical protein